MLKDKKFGGTLVVRYNGYTDSYYGSGDPKYLVPDALYLVEVIKEYPYHTEYYLKGFPRNYSYNSCWFEEVGELAGTPATRFERMYMVLQRR